jgi:hypothetical protein
MNLVQSVTIFSTEQNQQQQQRQEQLITPTRNDILCGRGRAFRQHPGNDAFNKTIRDNLQQYVDAPKRMDKTIIVATVVSSLRENGARFLKQDKKSQRFYEVADDEVHKKTGHAIGDLLKAQPDHQKTTKGTRPVEKSLFKATINQKKSLSSCFDLEIPLSSLSRHELLSTMSDISDALFRLDDHDVKKTAIPDLAMAADLFDLFETEKEVYCNNISPLPLSSETTLERSDFWQAFEILSEA